MWLFVCLFWGGFFLFVYFDFFQCYHEMDKYLLRTKSTEINKDWGKLDFFFFFFNISENTGLPESTSIIRSRIRSGIILQALALPVTAPPSSFKTGEETNNLLNCVWMKCNFPFLHIELCTKFSDLCKAFHIPFFFFLWNDIFFYEVL